MPERSYSKVARALAKSTTLIKRWAAEDGWQERVGAWDAELDTRRREEFAASTMDVAREQAETAARIRLGVDAFARSLLDELAAYSQRGEDPFADLITRRSSRSWALPRGLSTSRSRWSACSGPE